MTAPGSALDTIAAVQDCQPAVQYFGPDTSKRPVDFLLSVVIPAYNEEEGISECIRRLQEVMSAIGCRYELIFVNDGSKDRTLEILREEKQKNQNLKVINLSRNFGHQVAITAGVDNARGHAVITIDADLQDPPELFIELLAQWKAGYDVVYARRKRRAGESPFKRTTASIFYRLLKKIADVDLPVDVGDYRLLDRKAVNALCQLRERHRYVRGLVAWMGYKSTFVDYDRKERFAGETHYPLLKMLALSLDGLSSFSVVPLRLASICGSLSAIAGGLYMIYALYIKFVAHEAVLGWTSMMIAILFIGGIQLVCLGIMGEYIGILHEEVKQRPLYFISEID